MKLKALSLALLALPIASFAAEPVSHQPTDVSFSVEAEKEVERDLLQVSLFYQAEGNDLSALNKTMAEKMNKAIELAKQLRSKLKTILVIPGFAMTIKANNKAGLRVQN